MTKVKLLESLKAEVASINEDSLRGKLDELNLEISESKTLPPSKILSKYNIETMLELKNKVLATDENDSIDDISVQMLKSAIDTYLDKYSAGQNELKIYIHAIAVYLTFIAKKPLHPAGMFNAEGETLYRNGKVVCPLKKHEINKPGSLCRFCISIA